jgi:branched-chain amino acid transport system substrate-binding protein
VRFTPALAALAILASTCTGTSDEPTPTVVFVQDLSAPDAEEHAQPAREAVELAFAEGAPDVELEVIDVAEDPDAIDELSSDPSVVAAVVAPGADGSTVANAGVPTLSVSTAGPTPTDGAWRRFVAPMSELADAIAAEIGSGPACVLSDEPAPDELGNMLAERLGAPVTATDPEEAAAFAREAGCDVVAWAGSPDAAVELADVLPGVRIVGGDRLLDRDFRADVGPEEEGTFAACACVDVSTSLDPAVLRFFQDYQSEFGTAPGAYAVEAWDAANALVTAMSGGTDRAGIAEAVGSLSSLEGLVSTYGFEASGERVDPAVLVYELRAGRWVAR